VAHGDRVSVVDGQTGALIGEITGMPGGTHGIAISTASGQGFTDDGKAGQAAVFDLKTLQVVKRIDAKDDADGIVFDKPSGHIFVVDGDSKALTVIDPATDAVIATVDAGEGLETAVSGGDGKIYVDGAENRDLLRIDVKTNAVDARWPIAGCASPHGLALDKAAHRAFVSCVNKVMTVVDTDSGAVLASLPIGQGTDSAAFDPKRKLAFSSNGDGTLSIIREVDPQTFVSAGTIKTAATGRTMGIDPQTGRLYIAAADIDPNAQVPPGPGGRPGRPRIVPGSLKLLFLDPAN
jgi:YVTN family beta-propeller protein